MHIRTWCTPLLVCHLALIVTSTRSATASPSTMSGVDSTTVNYYGNAVNVAPALALAAGDDIDGAIVSIGSGLDDGGDDTLDIDGTLPAGIASIYDSNTGVLTLSGTTTPANYQAALRMVTFSTTASLPGTSRQITLSLGGALPNPDNGHYYLFVADSGISWTDANTAASSTSYFGRTGYLATITSEDENTFVFNKAGQRGWIGASDDSTFNGGDGEGAWEWVAGPEGGTAFWSGDANGSAVSGRYNNWDVGEPNNAGGEHYAHFLTSGEWNDLSNTSSVDGYYVEYGDLSGATPATNSGTMTVNLLAPRLLAIRNVHKKDASDQLCHIPDPTTGDIEIVGNLGTSHLWTKAMAVLPGENGDEDRIFAAERGSLLELDPQTGAAMLIGAIGWRDVTGLAFHPATGTLYGITYGTNRLLEIDIGTGAGTVVASRILNSSRLNDLAFHPDGDLYVVTSDSPSRIFEINPTTGKKITRWNLTGANGLESLLWSEDGETLYSAALRNGYKDLCTIDLDSSTVNFVSSTSSAMRDIEGLGWFRGDLGSSKPMAADEEPEDVEDPDELLDANAGSAEDDMEIGAAPARVRLLENIPNPFNPTTRIEYELPEASDVHLAVYDIAGRLVTTLASGRIPAGRHAAIWNGLDARGTRAGSGFYFYSLRAGDSVLSRRMVLLK